jgi:glycopeptide antibiotics resistance protein
MKFTDYWKPVVLLLVMCYLFFMPASQLPSEPFLKIPHFDKIVHFSLFFVLTLVFFRPVKKLTPNYYFWTPLVSLVVAVIIEFLQEKITASRSTDIYDFWANLCGTAFAVVFFRLLVSSQKWEKWF